jgi:general transcription factor 3C polypeptide 3 (transcription factor C subunit 4)
VAVCRFFMKEYQFTTDAYRMFAALARLCQSPISWYSSGPTQKYILRQIKAMDYALVDNEWRKTFFTEKGSYSSQDDSGKVIINDDMDIAMLMLYGHILYSGTSYAYALSSYYQPFRPRRLLTIILDYFFRAHALDPKNPMINLSIGLGYIHHGLKRQSENRQFHIMQGLSFLFNYYNSRNTSSRLEERQEAHYNIARIYQLLGLTHLALPYYQKVLQEAEGINDSSVTSEELIYDVVYNLQILFAAGGNIEMVRLLTDTWMII